MSFLQHRSAQNSSINRDITPNHRLQHKRKRDDHGDIEREETDRRKRSKAISNSLAPKKTVKAKHPSAVGPIPTPDHEKGEHYAPAPTESKPAETLNGKLAKRDRRKRRRNEREVETFQSPINGKEEQEGTASNSGQVARSRYLDEHSAIEILCKSPTAWKISEPVGGRFSDQEPLFSDDEK